MRTARRIAAMEALTAVAGMATLVLGVATGNWPVVLIAAALTSGAGLLAAVADYRKTEARADAAWRLHQMEAAIEQERGRELGIKERMSDLRAYYAGMDGPEGGAGRFRERVSTEPEPPSRDRGH